MNRTTTLIELQYLPCLEYFCALLKAEHIIFEVQENYQKQTYRNRTYILNSQGVQDLTIPIIKGNSTKNIQDTKIDYSEKWPAIHWRAICSAYGKAPFFEYFADEFHAIFTTRPTFLLDFTVPLLTSCLKLLNLPIPLEFSKKYIHLVIEGDNPKQYKDLRSVVHPKKSYLSRKIYQPLAYTQVFGSEFVPNLSIIDLLFCEGANALNVLKQSVYSC